jgi:hypothetical protein
MAAGRLPVKCSRVDEMQHGTPTLSSPAMTQDPEEQSPSASEEMSGTQVDDSAVDTEEEGPPTPFDHPLFLPVLLFAGMLWFGYDGFINTDPDMMEHQIFNQVGFAILTVLTAWFGYRGYHEFQEDKQREAEEDRRARS